MNDWMQNTEVVYELGVAVAMIVNGERLTMDEYHAKYPLIPAGELKEISKEDYDKIKSKKSGK